MGLLDRLFGRKKGAEAERSGASAGAQAGPATPPAGVQAGPATPPAGGGRRPANLKEYSGVLCPGVGYGLRYDAAMDQFIVQIQDSTGNYLKGTGMGPGQNTFATFALTEGEFALKDAEEGQASPGARVEPLVRRLLTELPRDRLLNAGCFDSTGRVTGKLELKPGCDSMDGGAYRRERSARLAAYLDGQQTLYVMHTQLMGPRYPAVDPGGRAWVFTREEYARRLQQANPGCELEYHACDREQFRAFVRSWYALGITRFALNPGSNDHQDVLERDLCFPLPEGERTDWAAAELNRWTLVYLQNRSLSGKVDNAFSLLLSWGALSGLIPGELYLVPMAYDSDGARIADSAVHLTQGALPLLQERANELIRKGEATAETAYGAALARYPGAAGYHIAGAAESSGGRSMHLRTTMAPNGDQFLCAFTSFDALRAIFRDTVRVALYSWDEITSLLDTGLAGSAAPIRGICINPGWTNLTLSRDDVQKLADYRAQMAKK